ncbi:P-selectin-like [Rhinoraja longicauda]
MVATYSCHSLYTLIGQKEISCSASGNWSHPPPTCKVVRCDSPEPPTNGHVMSGFGFELKYGDMITYRCGVGYDMIGSGVIECSEDNQFHPAPPTCNLIPCARPSSFHNGEITPDRRWYAYGDVVTFRCAPGYRVIGEDRGRCSDDGTFHPSPPWCVRESGPSRILTIQDLMKVIVPKARDILEEMKSIIKLERQLLQK